MKRLNITTLSSKTSLVFNILIILTIIIMIVTACSDNDDEEAQSYHRNSPSAQEKEYTHQQGGSPSQSWANKTESYSNNSNETDVITVRIDRNSIYIDELEYTRPEEAAEYLLSLKIKTQKLIELNLKHSKAKTSEQFQQMARAKGIFFNKIITE